MARKKKGELPSGNIRRQIYDHSELVFDESGKPVIDPKTGKQKKKRIYVSITADSKAEADLAKADYVVNKTTQKKPANLTLREAIQKYINTSDAVLSPTTIYGYEMIMENAFSGIMNMKLSALTPEHLKVAVNEESKRISDKTHKKISAKTVRNEYGLITAVLNIYAPALDNKVKLPARSIRRHEISTPDVIFDMVRGTKIELPVLLAMWLSFSLSEIKGLTKSKSISSDGNYITIVEVTVSIGQKEITKDAAKRETRHRTHRIPPYIKDLIAKVETDQLVPMSANSVSKSFKRLVLKAGIPYMTFHDLRHVSASVMKLLNIPDKYAQERGGWKSDNVMKGTYMQTFSTARIEVDNAIDRYFNKTLFHDDCDDEQNRKLFRETLKNKSIDEIYDVIKAAGGNCFNSLMEYMQHEMQHENQNSA